jgi:hypothetical protein
MPERGAGLLTPAPFSKELLSVSPGRRRLGYLVIAGAILLGTAVLLSFFVSSLYMSNPQAAEAAILEALSRSIAGQLDPDAMDRAAEIDDAFRMLTTATETSPLGWRALWALLQVTAEAGADGVIEVKEVDALLAALRDAARRATTPQRL